MEVHQPTDVNSAGDTDDGKVFLHFTMSLDGFIADTAGALEPTGRRPMVLHSLDAAARSAQPLGRVE